MSKVVFIRTRNPRGAWFWDYSAVFSSGELSPYEILVRLYLASKADARGGYASASIHQIASGCGISKPSTLRALRGLLQKGWLVKEQNVNGETGAFEKNTYYLLPPPGSALPRKRGREEARE